MLLISGLSGAGKSTILHSLEDAGYFCTDNLPLELLHDWSTSMLTRKQPAAVCLDTRCGFTATAIRAVIESLPNHKAWQLIFVEAEDQALLHRFSTLKRRHPYPSDGGLTDAIDRERKSLLPIRNLADLILDSSQLTPYELAEQVDLFRLKPGEKRTSPSCTIISFSYKKGLPTTADIVFDMRFLPNPHYLPELAQQTGRDAGVIAFLEKYQTVKQAEQHIQQWLAFTWPLICKERKQYFTLAIGCSGGRHRSVYMCERIGSWFRSQGWDEPRIEHRELQQT